MPAHQENILPFECPLLFSAQCRNARSGKDRPRKSERPTMHAKQDMDEVTILTAVESPIHHTILPESPNSFPKILTTDVVRARQGFPPTEPCLPLFGGEHDIKSHPHGMIKQKACSTIYVLGKALPSDPRNARARAPSDAMMKKVYRIRP